jgi:hypothetical protein
MFIYFYVNLHEGDLCVVNNDQHPYQGQIIRFKQLEYVMQCPLYIFEAMDRHKVVLNSEFDFTMIPYKESLRFLIDLSIKTRDEVWFKELVDQLLHRSQ